ncbi:MAG: sulfotransferase domain-containing protein [Gammaproteobacteria bacterium]|nr:sulfotransferase domain-containing protein [Gammaproteobacteria bacterium]
MSDRLLFHSCYHKCLTFYFYNVYKTFAESHSMKLQYLHNDSQIMPDTDLLLDPHSLIKERQLLDNVSSYRGSHVIRDPRDLLISAYFYHLKTDEEWCAKPNPVNVSLPADVSYQQHLLDLNQEDGLLYELNHVAGAAIHRMASWDYGDAEILELRYEHILGDERATFKHLFEWYGFDEDMADQAASIADSLALKNVAAHSAMQQHARSGSRIGQWRDFFTPAIKRTFKHRYGEALIKLGYCDSLNW